MRRRLAPPATLFVAAMLIGPLLCGQTTSVRGTYHVKQIASGAVYLDGGSDDGLKEGMHLKVYRVAPGQAQMARQEIGDITVIAVASISAACEAKEGAQPIEIGDTAELSYRGYAGDPGCALVENGPACRANRVIYGRGSAG